MTRARSILCNPLVSMTLIAAGVAATGCVESTQPASGESVETSSDRVVITDREALSGLSLQTVAFQRTAQGDQIVAPGWTQTAPDEWTQSAHGATTTIKVTPKVTPAQSAAAPPPPVTCNLNFFIGPSSSLGLIGGAAIGQADCLDGAVAFTITVTVCTDLFPACVTQSGVGVASPGLPFTFGIAVPGTAGATCAGAVQWVPPGVSTSALFACG